MTSPGGDAWTPAHTRGCRSGAESRREQVRSWTLDEVCERFGLDRDELGRRVEHRARAMRRLERLTAELKVVTRRRNELAMRCSSFSGRPWEEELANVGVDLGTARDPGPSAVVPMDSLPSFREQFAAEGRSRWSEADETGEVTVPRTEDGD